MLRLITTVLIFIFIVLQYKLWFGDGGLFELWGLQDVVAQQRMINSQVEEQNAALAAEVEDLKMGDAALEERARTELGMIKEDEVFYQVVDGRKHANHFTEQ